jgi:hypothetical protein
VIPGLEIPPQYGYPFLTACVLAIIGGIIQRILKNRPGPPTVAEAWDETRKVRDEMTNMRAGFDVLFSWMERAVRDWNTGKPLPRFSAHDREIIDKIRPAPEEPISGPLEAATFAEMRDLGIKKEKR